MRGSTCNKLDTPAATGVGDDKSTAVLNLAPACHSPGSTQHSSAGQTSPTVCCEAPVASDAFVVDDRAWSNTERVRAIARTPDSYIAPGERHPTLRSADHRTDLITAIGESAVDHQPETR
jgi:hypothetical protein